MFRGTLNRRVLIGLNQIRPLALANKLASGFPEQTHKLRIQIRSHSGRVCSPGIDEVLDTEPDRCARGTGKIRRNQIGRKADNRIYQRIKR